MKLSFVIPCYRSEATIKRVVDEIHEVVALRADVDYEIVLVSDHSPDNVYKVIETLCKNDPTHHKGLELARNFGQHAALMAGYSAAAGDYVISLDDDGQTPVDAVWSMLDALEAKGADVVYASYADKRHSVFRNWGSRINGWMACWLLNKPAALKLTSYFVVRRFVIDEVLRYRQAFPYVIGLVLRVTGNIVNVPVNHRDRSSGTSGYTFRKLLGLWMNGFTAFSVKPLRMASFIGMSCSLLGFAYGVWTVINKLVVHPDAPLGYSSLMSAVLFIGGAIMMLLGLIGEYIGRMYMCLNNSPQYVVSRRTFAISGKE